MAKVYYEPYKAIKYVGAKAKVFHTSLARPKPKLVKGDIVIVDKVTAFNLVNKGFGDFVSVDTIEFVKSEKDNAERISLLEEENIRLKEELAVSLELIMQDDKEDENVEESGHGIFQKAKELISGKSE